jgi:PIN domain nuclease of toxin-antitoxin system
VRLLLDTHVIIWVRAGSSRLSSRFRSAIADPANELWFSSVSVWELSMLFEKRAQDFNIDPLAAGDWISRAIDGMHEAPVNQHVARESRRVIVSHQDPADRFIAATAKVFELTLVTADSRLLKGSGYEVLR